MSEFALAHVSAVNRFLAEREGWRIGRRGHKYFCDRVGNGGFVAGRIQYPCEADARRGFPNYCKDRNALARIEAGLTPEQWTIYAQRLIMVPDVEAAVRVLRDALSTGVAHDQREVFLTFATVAATRALPCAVCAMELARVLGMPATFVIIDDPTVERMARAMRADGAIDAALVNKLAAPPEDKE